MEICVKSYNELTIDELYDIMALRSNVFVVEQNCVYQDLDYKDQKAIHVLGYLNDKLIAYTRIFGPGDYFKNPSIGRVTVSQKERGKYLGHKLMEASISVVLERFTVTQIDISAQSYLEEFYKTHGFKASGSEYLEDGIPHKKMIKTM